MDREKGTRGYTFIREKVNKVILLHGLTRKLKRKESTNNASLQCLASTLDVPNSCSNVSPSIFKREAHIDPKSYTSTIIYSLFFLPRRNAQMPFEGKSFQTTMMKVISSQKASYIMYSLPSNTKMRKEG